MGKTLSKKTNQITEPPKDDRPSSSLDTFTMGKNLSKETEDMTGPPKDDRPSTSLDTFTMGKNLSKETEDMTGPPKDDRPSTSLDTFMMGENPSKETEEMTGPPKDDRPSTSLDTFTMGKNPSKETEEMTGPPKDDRPSTSLDTFTMGKTLSKKTKKIAEPPKDDSPSTSLDTFTMGKKLSKETEEMTGPPKDDRPSTSGQTSIHTNGFDGVIIKAADAISEDCDLRRLGLELGVQTPDINRALETNWVGGRKTSNGNVMLLQNWAETVKPSEQLSILRAALQAAGLKEIEETCLQRKGEQDEMPHEVQRLREKLKARYIEEFSEVKVSPMDPESRTWLQHIFVSLILMLGCRGDQKKEIHYEDLFSLIQDKTEKGFITRLAFLGEAGVGKSTLFAKIALDWATGKCLQDITLLFHESFRDMEDSPFFGDIVMNHFPDDTEINGESIDKYIKQNQRKFLILLDGLDEAKMDITCPNHKLAIVSIARRERFIDTSVLISSRPFGADQFKSIPKIHEKYSYILVEGFTKANTNQYIKQFFNDDSASASSLIHFINTNRVVSEFMAPFPIFCCMLCYMWKVESKRETTEKLQTISQLMKEIDFALREQYSSRYTDREGGYQCHMEKAVEAITKVGRVAFEGLLNNKLIFTKEEMEACDEAEDDDAVMAVACQVGILSGKKRLASKKIRQKEGTQFIQEFCFPHKLLQEHTASIYLASLYNHNRSEFNRILTHKLLKDYKEFRYVFYFTAAHGGEVGKSVMEALCNEVDDMEFNIQCAFECHDSEAIDPVRNLLKTKTDLKLRDNLAPLLFTLETLGKEVVRRSSSIRKTLGDSESFEANASSPDVAAAVGLFTLQNLRGLRIKTEGLDDEFFTGMSAAAPQSMIEELSHMDADLGSAASSHYARGLCSMPNFRSLSMCDVKLSDEFYSTMASKASNSKIQKLSMQDASIAPCQLHSILSLPHLQSLSLWAIRPVDMDDGETLTRHIISESVDKLSVDGNHVTSLWKSGLHKSCPRVKTLELDWLDEENVSSDIVAMACSPFHHLTHLHIQGDLRTSNALDDHVSFCEAVITSCPRLTKLSMCVIVLLNKRAVEITKLMKTHARLTNIELDRCGTDTDLDPLISEVNSEGKLTVTVEHGGNTYGE